MSLKTILLFVFCFLVIAGAIGAVDQHWWRPGGAGGVAAAQTLPSAASEYGRLLERYDATDSAMDVSGTIRIYDGERGEVLKETSTFRNFRQGAAYFTQLSYLRTYCDGRLVLVVDSVHRQLEVSRSMPQAGRKAAFPGLSPDILFSDTARFRISGMVEQQHAERVLTVRSDYNPEMKLYRLYYDTMSYRIQRTEIEWWKDGGGRDTTDRNVWLAKVDYSFKSHGVEDIGAEIRSYIVEDVGKVRPTARYADYGIKVNY